MKREKLRCLLFMALCCDLGMFAKKLIAPAANIITDSLHIPGGISTGFSLMFLVLAAVFVRRFGSALLMGAVQSCIALCMGSVGSMGALAPLGYLFPALLIDCILLLGRKLGLGRSRTMLYANIAASVGASLVTDLIVFHLPAAALLLYLGVSAFSGGVCGMLGALCADKLTPSLGAGGFIRTDRK